MVAFDYNLRYWKDQKTVERDSMKESKTLEFKLIASNTFLKTVSAYANYGGGSILFGVDDDGRIIGMSDPEQTCLDIENRINDSIDPNPDYALSIKAQNVVELKVREGLHKPYLYKAKAYKRNDTSTIEVDRIELARLVLEGSNLSFEETPARTGGLSFSYLAQKFRDVLGVEEVTHDTLKTLEFETKDGSYTVAGELFADANSFPGVDVARFGDSIDIFLDRQAIENVSILRQYDEALGFFRRYYEFERVAGSQRETVQTVPESAFREAVANALVHRQWDASAAVRIAMHPDRIEVTSPGGLPHGLSEEEYLNGQVTALRNPIVGSVFFRLGLIEHFGTGVLRIKESYRDSVSNPLFKIYENSITVVLPLVETEGDLSSDERVLMSILNAKQFPISLIVEKSGFGRSKAKRLLKDLSEKGLVTVIGSGRGTKYGA